MRIKRVGNKYDAIAVNVKNADTAAIPVGSPVVLAFNATDDGLAVVLPSTAASLTQIKAMPYGVMTRTLAVGDLADSICFGFVQNLLLLRQTRASSTNTWASEVARSVGEHLSIDTVNNAFVTAISVVSGLTISTQAAQAAILTLEPRAALGQTLASYSSSASATSDTRTAITALVRAFVRMM